MSPEDSGKSTEHQLVKAAGVMGLLTLLSRVLGMLRDIICAGRFGTTWQWDAFIYAFMIPNFFRRLVAEGALTSSFIPVYSSTLANQGKDAAFRFANISLTFMMVAFIIFLGLVEFGLNWAFSSVTMSPTLKLAVDLMRIFFPFLWAMSIYALGMGILHSHKKFFVPALGPVLLNIFWIVGAIWSVSDVQSVTVQLHWLAYILLAAGVVHILVELPVLYKLGYRVRFIWDIYSKELRKAGALLLPAILGFAVVPLNILVDMTLGLMIGEGANSSLWYGNRLMMFPLGIFAVAMGNALLPTLSEQAAGKDTEKIKKTLSFSIKSVMLIILPASAGLLLLSEPIIRLLFERGEFDSLSTARTSAVLFCYCLGLFAYSGQKVLISAFYANHDTKTPAIIAIIALFINIVFNLLLMGPLREAGLALATSISGVFQFFLLFYMSQKKVVAVNAGELWSSILRILLATIAMSFVCFGTYGLTRGLLPGNGLISQVSAVFAPIVVSMIVYPVFCLIFRVEEIKSLLTQLGKKLRPAS